MFPGRATLPRWRRRESGCSPACRTGSGPASGLRSGGGGPEPSRPFLRTGEQNSGEVIGRLVLSRCGQERNVQLAPAAQALPLIAPIGVQVSMTVLPASVLLPQAATHASKAARANAFTPRTIPNLHGSVSDNRNARCDCPHLACPRRTTPAWPGGEPVSAVDATGASCSLRPHPVRRGRRHTPHEFAAVARRVDADILGDASLRTRAVDGSPTVIRCRR